MNDIEYLNQIDRFIRQGRLARSAAVGAAIGSGLAAAWRGIEKFTQLIALKAAALKKTPAVTPRPIAQH